MARTGVVTPIEVEEQNPETVIPQLAERCAKDIRHADVISYDPEGQRIKSLITAACWAAYELAVPKDDGRTTHITTQANVKFAVHGLQSETIPEGWTGQAADVLYIGTCATCKHVHDPHRQYDHPAVPPKGRKDKTPK